MLGRNPGWVTTQGELLADRFVAAGWQVRETSSIPSRPVRLLDTVCCLLRWRRHIDVVALSVFSGPAFVMADITSALTKALGIPTVLWLHGGNLPSFRSRHPKWVQRVLRRRTVVAPSRFLADELAPATNEPIEVIPNLIDLSSLPFRCRKAATPRLLWMRTFHPIYNPAMAVRALDVLRHDHPDASLTMAGQEKGLTAAVRTEVTERKLAEMVTFAGFLGPADKPRVFDEHDIYLHTNHVDNTPVSVLEAAAAGLPIVATEVGGIPHLLAHEQTALLVPDNDHRAMAAAVESLLDDPGLTERLSTNARRLAEASAWPAVQQLWADVFERSIRRD